MRKTLLGVFFVPALAIAQSSMDVYRWYLNPEGQHIQISIDDLNDEDIYASPSLKWGRELVPTLELKKDVVIAVIDGGIEIEHPELKNNIAYNSAECFEGKIIPPKDGEDKDQNGYKGDCAGWDFVGKSNRPEDLDGHGTHVAGVINSVMNGVKGNFKLLPLKVFAPDEGRSTTAATTPLSSRLTAAFEYAIARKVDVIHLSVGWPKSYMSFELDEAIKKALAQNILIVAAAGNSSQRATIYPCQLDGVICVGALRPDATAARFSNWGSQVDIFAPGEKILSTIPNTIAPFHISRKGYDFKNGTSQAAPFISGALALLRGAFPNELNDALYARLLQGANKAEEGKGLKGMFHLEKSLKASAAPFVYPQLKGLHSVVVENNKFSIKLPFKNFWKAKTTTTAVSLICKDAQIVKAKVTLPALGSSDSHTFAFQGVLKGDQNFLDCDLRFGNETLDLRLKVQHKLREAFKTHTVKQSDLLVINTRTGARSRFLTLNPIKGTVPGPLYYVMIPKGVDLYRENIKLGSPKMPENCSFLRAWQIDLDGDKENEFMIEGICDKTHLLYQFVDQNLQEIYPSVRYKPSLTIVNYDDFEVIPQKNLPPSFRFMNRGFVIPTDTPWDSDISSQSNHLYELVPVKDGDHFKFEVTILENPKAWQKSLKLRYMPAYQVLHSVNGKLLIKIGEKTAWVNLATQEASWAGLDHVLLAGSRKQTLVGTNESILQSFLTPFEYRGFMLSGVSIRFIQTDKFDPLLDVLGTEQNKLGYKTVVRSFQKLLYLQFDFKGVLIEKKESIVDRFDFLTAQDLIASVANLRFNDELIQLVDGSKINTSYVDLMKDGTLKSFEIPSPCVTQTPVVMENRAVLPVFCAKSRTEFVMNFIELGDE